MPIGLHELQFYNQNSIRNLPFADSASRTDTSGSFTIPNSLIVDLALPVHWGNSINPAGFYVSQLRYFTSSVQIIISHTNGSSTDRVGSVTCTFDTHVKDVSYDIIGVGNFADTTGHIAIGSLADLLELPPADYSFTVDTGRLDLNSVKPNLRGLASLQVNSEGSLSRPFQGRIRLAAGRNFRIDVIEEAGKDPVIVLNAISGEGTLEDCACDSTSSDPIRTINGVGPDALGNLDLVPGKCFVITPQQFGLLFSNPCSTPCCGPEALEKVVEQLEPFGSKATTLENFLVNLEARVTQTDQVILGSRLGDRGCTPPEDCP